VVVFVLLAVYCLASVSLFEKVGVEWAIQNASVNLCVAVPLVADDLEKGGATTAGLSKHQDHLTGLDDALEILEDVELRALLAKAKEGGGGAKDIEKGYKCVGERLRGVSHNIRSSCKVSLVLTAYLDVVLYTTYTKVSANLM
jgi:hypothetical protein